MQEKSFDFRNSLSYPLPAMVSRWAEVAPAIKARVPQGEQKILAGKMGLTASKLNRYLGGKTVPDPVLAIRLASSLGLDLAELSGFGPSPVARSSRDGETVAFPLVAEGIAAGFGAIPEEPEERTDYHFRKGWKGIRGWDADHGRYVLFRLKRDADSMSPEIHPHSLILADRSEGARLNPKPNGYYLVLTQGPDHVAVKRVMPVRDGEKITRLVLVSANPLYPPKEIAVKRIQDVIRAKVVWWGTEAT